MASVTFAADDTLKAGMARFPWVNWSEAAREELAKQEKTREDFERFKAIVAKSKLTEEDAKELADEVNMSLAKRYEKLLKGRA